eukprot:UN23132
MNDSIINQETNTSCVLRLILFTTRNRFHHIKKHFAKFFKKNGGIHFQNQ